VVEFPNRVARRRGAQAQCGAIEWTGDIVQLLKEFHVAFAYLTLASFVVRGLLSLAESPLRNAKWMRIAPHVIDTFLLVFGI
jgi:hypothetical protein